MTSLKKTDYTGMVEFEMFSDLFIYLAFEDFRKAGQDGYRSITVWV